MIDDELSAKIRRLHQVEQWRINTIADELGIHHSTVRRALTPVAAEPASSSRPSKLDRFEPLIRRTLKSHPRLTGTTIHRMLHGRGHRGAQSEVRRFIRERQLRPQRPNEAFMQLSYLPGEQAQVDWAYLDSVRVGNTERRVYALLVVLSYSRAMHVGFYHDMTASTVAEAHADAFDYFGGVPRKIVYDNMKTAVVDRRGRAIRWHQQLLACADHYGFEPVAARVRRPTDKARVERNVRYLRSSFLAGQRFHSLKEHRAGFVKWRRDVAHARPHPSIDKQSVSEAFAEERKHLRALPKQAFATDLVRVARVDAYAHVQFETNRYSVPPRLVRQQLTLLVNSEWVRVVDRGEVVCVHPRSWQRKQTFTHENHQAEVRRHKPRAHDQSARKRLVAELPIAEKLLIEAAKRNEPLGPQTTRLRQLVMLWGADAVDLACEQAIERGTPRADSVAWLLQRGDITPRPCLDAALLPDRAGIRDLRITSHPMSNYDPQKKGASDDKQQK